MTSPLFPMVADFFRILASAMIPITELRLTIPLFLGTRPDLPVLFVVVTAILGNMVPNFFLLWFFPRFTGWLHECAAPRINRFIHWLHNVFVKKERIWVVITLVILVLLTTLGTFVERQVEWISVLVVLLGEAVVVVVAWLILRKIYRTSLSHKSVIHWFYEKVNADHSEKFYRYGSLALVIIVAIPLPGTGSWTGSLLAFLFGIPYWRAMGFIFVGVVIAACIMTAASTGVISLFSPPDILQGFPITP